MLKKLSIISVLLILLGFLSSTVLATSDMSNYMRDAGNNIGEAARNTADGVGNVVENTWDATKNTASAVGNAVENTWDAAKNTTHAAGDAIGNTAGTVTNGVKNMVDTSESGMQSGNSYNFLGLGLDVWMWIILIAIVVIAIVLICKYMKEHNDHD